ncbi:hypothetical protein HYH03_006039 [Edaphochlamys debaryana]|uniref:Uncharacterized protein n=1 Tax=Edaphochlamys debaryana TaxID=47281 RepID=A0A835Y4F6_9CHLO|nr:hypothetical protein HYH03_006039 [Edaphochlamys debaryana]|eukprot:KAG2495796.1 hypothetical protein HYH03_006039 [Edaphochlamys debaryana]
MDATRPDWPCFGQQDREACDTLGMCAWCSVPGVSSGPACFPSALQRLEPSLRSAPALALSGGLPSAVGQTATEA